MQRSIYLNFRLSPAEMEAVQRLADRQLLKPSELFRSIIRAELARHGLMPWPVEAQPEPIKS